MTDPFAPCRCGHRYIDHSGALGCEVQRGGLPVDDCGGFRQDAEVNPVRAALIAALDAVDAEMGAGIPSEECADALVPLVIAWVTNACAVGIAQATERAQVARLVEAEMEAQYRAAWDAWTKTADAGEPSKVLWARVNQVLDDKTAICRALTAHLSVAGYDENGDLDAGSCRCAIGANHYADGRPWPAEVTR